MSPSIRHLTSNDTALMEALLTTFGDAFNEVNTYRWWDVENGEARVLAWLPERTDEGGINRSLEPTR